MFSHVCNELLQFARPELYQKSNRSSHSSDTSSAYSGSDTMTSVHSSVEADDVDLSGLVESVVDSDEEDLAESTDVSTTLLSCSENCLLTEIVYTDVSRTLLSCCKDGLTEIACIALAVKCQLLSCYLLLFNLLCLLPLLLFILTRVVLPFNHVFS